MYKKGFTLIEIIVVVIIVAVLAALAIMRYTKVIEQSREREACLQLVSIHTANEIYKDRAHEYLPGSNLNLAAINTGLGLNMFSSDFVFDYDRDAMNPFLYQVTADYRRGASSVFVVRLNQDEITMQFSALNPAFSDGNFLDDFFIPRASAVVGCTVSNPCCLSGRCPTLPGCC